MIEVLTREQVCAVAQEEGLDGVLRLVRDFVETPGSRRLARARAQAHEIVGQGSARPSEAPGEASDLGDAAFDHTRLEQQTYLTVRELAAFGRFPSIAATRKWLATHPEVPALPRGRRGRRLLINRRDFENALQPRHECHIAQSGARRRRASSLVSGEAR